MQLGGCYDAQEVVDRRKYGGCGRAGGNGSYGALYRAADTCRYLEYQQLILHTATLVGQVSGRFSGWLQASVVRQDQQCQSWDKRQRQP